MSVTKEQLLSDIESIGDFSLVSKKHGKPPVWVYEKLMEFGVTGIKDKKGTISKDQFEADLKELGSTRAVSEKYGKSPCWGSAIAKRLGVIIEKRDNSAYDQQIYDLYFNHGKSLSEVSRATGVPTASIQCRFEINGWKMRSRTDALGKRRRFDHEECALLYESGMSTLQLAQKYGVRHQSIAAILEKKGVVARRPGYKGSR